MSAELGMPSHTGLLLLLITLLKRKVVYRPTCGKYFSKQDCVFFFYNY